MACILSEKKYVKINKINNKKLYYIITNQRFCRQEGGMIVRVSSLLTPTPHSLLHGDSCRNVVNDTQIHTEIILLSSDATTFFVLFIYKHQVFWGRGKICLANRQNLPNIRRWCLTFFLANFQNLPSDAYNIGGSELRLHIVFRSGVNRELYGLRLLSVCLSHLSHRSWMICQAECTGWDAEFARWHARCAGCGKCARWHAGCAGDYAGCVGYHVGCAGHSC